MHTTALSSLQWQHSSQEQGQRQAHSGLDILCIFSARQDLLAGSLGSDFHRAVPGSEQADVVCIIGYFGSITSGPEQSVWQQLYFVLHGPRLGLYQKGLSSSGRNLRGRQVQQAVMCQEHSVMNTSVSELRAEPVIELNSSSRFIRQTIATTSHQLVLLMLALPIQ